MLNKIKEKHEKAIEATKNKIESDSFFIEEIVKYLKTKVDTNLNYALYKYDMFDTLTVEAHFSPEDKYETIIETLTILRSEVKKISNELKSKEYEIELDLMIDGYKRYYRGKYTLDEEIVVCDDSLGFPP